MCVRELIELLRKRSAKIEPLELKDADVQFLQQKTGFRAREIRFWFKKFQEDCPDGRLTKPRFVKMFSKLFHEKAAAAETLCEHIFRTFDQDQSGCIDFKEFLVAIGLITSENAIERFRWAYKMYDIDGDGSVEIEELTKVVLSICELHLKRENLPVDKIEQRIREVFKKVDCNTDGQVSCEEFIQVCFLDPQLAEMLCIAGGTPDDD